VGNWSIKGNLVNNGRCPKCTLKIPCKHYDKVDDLPAVKGSSQLLPPPTKVTENVVPNIAIPST